ncbi:MAG: hypothetical protein QNJ72_39395 [Pleurocapsa sp. MO_226.B13]|nr:hypothetical protein [Pleurocapsa sp. MO_226.B13]
MNEQLCLFELGSDKKSVSLPENGSDAKRQAIQRFLDTGKRQPIACVNTYSPGRRDTEYFRLSYRVGRKKKHIHIPGGSTIAELARYRAKKLQELIERGAELEEIIAMVHTFRSGQK